MEEGDGSNGFNLGILCCIPKGEGEENAQHSRAMHGNVIFPSRPVPLSFVDVSNRMIASAYKYHWERFLGPWVSKEQTGFIPGRSMMANVMQIEAHSLEVASTRQRGMMILVDFRAAFLSVSHDFTKLLERSRCLGSGLERHQLNVL